MRHFILRAVWIVVSLGFVLSSQTALAGTLTNVVVMPSSNVVLETNKHAVSFRPGTTATVKTIEVAYPAGFGLTNNLIEAIRANSIGTQSFLNGALTVSGQSLIYTLPGSGTSLPTGDTIKIQVGNVVNATGLSNAITITTKNSSGGTIDTGSATMTLIQVSTSMIGDGAVTNAKLGANSVDSTKIVDLSVITDDLADGVVTGLKLATASVDQSKIVDGAVTNTKLAAGSVDLSKMATDSVESSKILDGSVTASDLANDAVSSPKVLDGSLTRADIQPIAHHIVVATSGGDYTTISAALSAINPTTTDPYVIDVMPGTYSETITMKSYVHLRGAGRDVTTLWAPSINSDVITVWSLSNVAISGLTIFGGGHAIVVQSSSPTIRDNIFYFNQDGITIDGDYGASGSPIIENNLIRENRGYGISITNSPATIRGNTIVKNGETGIVTSFSAATIRGNIVSENRDGIWSVGTFPAPTIRENTISANQGFGIYLYAPATVVHNTVTGNQAVDVLSGEGTANISFNVYDTIGGITGTGHGQFNVNSSGGLAPAP